MSDLTTPNPQSSKSKARASQPTAEADAAANGGASSPTASATSSATASSPTANAPGVSPAATPEKREAGDLRTPEYGAAATAHAAEAGAERLRDTTEQATGAAGRVADQTLEAGRRVSEQGVDIARKTAGATLDAARRQADAGLEMHRDAADAGRDMVRASQRAFDQASDFWRQSLQPFASLHLEMNRLFDDTWRQMSTGLGFASAMRPASPMGGGGLAALMGQPPADLKDTGDGYCLALELPGLKPEDVSITVSDNALVISGHKTEARDEATGAYRVSERRYGRFERSFPIPQDVDRDSIEADLQHGVLTLTLPRSQGAAQAQRRIEVRG